VEKKIPQNPNIESQFWKLPNAKINLSKIHPGKLKDKDCVSDFQNQWWWWCLWVFGICLAIHQIIEDKIYLRPKIDYDEVKIKICFTQKKEDIMMNLNTSKYVWDWKEIMMN
jgi:hypothetical protein